MSLLAGLPVLLSGLAAPAHALGPRGSVVSSEWYETITAPDGDIVWFQVHYPAVSDSYGADADPSGGPYPVIGLMHGYLGQAWMYDTAADALATMGFVVVNIDTETGPVLDPERLAQETTWALEWLEARSGEDHWLQGMADLDHPWTVMGHSMGGIAMARLVDADPRVGAAVGFAPYRDDDHRWDAYADFTGPVLLLGGTEDETSTPEILLDWFDDLDQPRRGLHPLIQGVGHQAITDIEFEPEPLSDAEQREANLQLTETFLLAELLDEDDRYHGILCQEALEFVPIYATGTEPVATAAVVEPSLLQLGLAHRADQVATIHGGLGPGETAVGDGTVVLGLHDAVALGSWELGAGAVCGELSLPEELAGRAWLQVEFGGGVLSRVLNPFDTDGELPDEGGGDGADGSGDGADGSGDGADGSGDGADGSGTGADTDGGADEPDAGTDTSAAGAADGGEKGAGCAVGAAAPLWVGWAALAVVLRRRERTCPEA